LRLSTVDEKDESLLHDEEVGSDENYDFTTDCGVVMVCREHDAHEFESMMTANSIERTLFWNCFFTIQDIVFAFCEKIRLIWQVNAY
jgi:hypothetical protein